MRKLHIRSKLAENCCVEDFGLLGCMSQQRVYSLQIIMRSFVRHKQKYAFQIIANTLLTVVEATCILGISSIDIRGISLNKYSLVLFWCGQAPHETFPYALVVCVHLIIAIQDYLLDNHAHIRNTVWKFLKVWHTPLVGVVDPLSRTLYLKANRTVHYFYS